MALGPFDRAWATGAGGGPRRLPSRYRKRHRNASLGVRPAYQGPCRAWRYDPAATPSSQAVRRRERTACDPAGPLADSAARIFHAGWRSTGRKPIPDVYTIEIDRAGDITHVRITSPDADLAASGYAVQTRNAFIYDRIVTAQDHWRKGLGNAVMATLRRAGHDRDTPELLVATSDGRALYASIGWRTLSPYSTAALPDT